MSEIIEIGKLPIACLSFDEYNAEENWPVLKEEDKIISQLGISLISLDEPQITEPARFTPFPKGQKMKLKTS